MWIFINEEKGYPYIRCYEGDNPHKANCSLYNCKIYECVSVHKPTKEEPWFEMTNATRYETLDCYDLGYTWSHRKISFNKDTMSDEAKNNFDFFKKYSYNDIVKIEEKQVKKWFGKSYTEVSVELDDYLLKPDETGINYKTNIYAIVINNEKF